MRNFLTALLSLLMAALCVTVFGLFAATTAARDHAPHLIIGQPADSPLASAATGRQHLAI